MERNNSKESTSKLHSAYGRLTGWIHRLDQMPLSYLVFPLLALVLYYYIKLGKQCVFEINDQLDETLITYVLNAKYLFQNVKEYPELLGGVPAGGMTVSAWIFVPLYRLLPVFEAFMVQYTIVLATAYLGMYLAVKELTDSSILGVICGVLFLLLPYQPVYGLSIVGGPLILYVFLCIYQGKRLWLCQLLLWYFALGANLVLLGYVVLGLAFCADIFLLYRDYLRKSEAAAGIDTNGQENKQGNEQKNRQENKWESRRGSRRVLLATLELLIAYVLINISLFQELLLGNGGYVSHREEMVVRGTDFGSSVVEVFLHSAQHAPTHHEKLILPIAVVGILYGILWPRLDQQGKRLYLWLITIIGVNLVVAVFYGICQSEYVANWRNQVSGFFHYFAANRVYWIYPTSWYLAVGLAAALVWRYHGRWPDLLAGLLILLTLLPTAWEIRQNSNWILNKSQYKNHCSVGLMSWQDYFAEDLMEQIADGIREKTGLEQHQYRIASLGMCPAVPLQAGFYCIDGYSNNYRLEYKHAFREIIAGELDKCAAMQDYFDNWGSRCYLFTEESQNYYYLQKDADFQYQRLTLDTGRMQELGCDYLFAAAQIAPDNARELGLELMGVYDTADSYYRIWVYEIRSNLGKG